MTKPKSASPKPARPNAHLEERAAAVKGGKGKLLKPKAETPPAPQAEAAPRAETPAHPVVRVPMPVAAHPDTYGLRVDDSGLGLHAAPGATVMVEPVTPTKAGLAVFYMKGRPGPLIFDLTRNFRPEFAGPFAPGSEVMPLIEVVAPCSGQFGRIRADKIEKMHRVLGVYTPSEVMEEYGPTPSPLPEMPTCPEGMGEHYVEGAAAYPLVRPDETVVYNPSQREPTHGALCVLQWGNGSRDVLQTNRRPISREGEERWFVDPVNRPRHVEPGAMLYASDGPYTEAHLREKIVGTVVGILAPRRETSGPHAFVPTPQATPPADDAPTTVQTSTLAQACDQAVRDWNAIRPASQAENWGDEQLDEALNTYDAVFQRAIDEPSRDVADVQAKARLLLHDLIAHTTGHAPSDEATLTVDERLTRVVLREVAALSSSTTLASLPDPILAAIQAHAGASKAFAATVNPQDRAWVKQNGGDTSDEAMAPAHAAYEAANEAEAQASATLFKVRPTTLPGVLALVRHAQQYAPGNDGLTGGPTMEEVFGAIADGLADAMGADENNEPFTMESAATLDFRAYDIETPLRDPREWAERLSHQALGLHVADRVLRQSRDELATWIGGAAEDVAKTMLKAMDYASEEFEGLAKFTDTARTRCLIAMSVLATRPEGQG